MHKRKPDFNSLKFTPKTIHNRLDIPINELIIYFKKHSLNECAEYFKCSATTIKRKLRNAGVDTSIHNHSELAKINRNKTSKLKPNKDELIDLFINSNLDTKSISELYGLHFNTIRSLLRKHNIRKSSKLVSKSMMNRHLLKHGVDHPSQRPDVIAKTSISLNKVIYKGICFKSITELGYALYLDKHSIEWYYEEMIIPYIDMLTGKRRIYVIDFTVVGETVNWVEIKPHNEMIPEDKRIYASRRAEESNIIYRGLTDEERTNLWSIIEEGYNFDKIEFLHRTPRSNSSKITYYFKSEKEAIDFHLTGWEQFTKPTNRGALWKKILIRE